MIACRRFFTLLALVASMLVVARAVPAVGAPLSETDLAKLVELQIGDDAIVAKIQRDGLSFTVSGEVRERIKRTGGSERVLAAMEKAGKASQPAAVSQETAPIMVWVKREYGSSENPLSTEFSVNGKLVDIFTSDTRKDIGKYLQHGWNTITLKTTPQQGATDNNQLTFRIGPVHKDPKSDQLVMKPVLWKLCNGTDWKYHDGKYSHRLGPDAKEVTLNYRVYYAGWHLEMPDVKNGDYVLHARPWYGSVNSPLTLTVFVNGTALTSFLGEERQVPITALLKEGKNDFRVVSSRVKDAMADNDMSVQVIGPLQYSPRSQRFEGKPIVEIKAGQGWEREKPSGQLVSKANPQADSIERNVAFVLDEAPSVARRPQDAPSGR